MPRIDYYFTTQYSSIAVDVESSRIAVLEFDFEKGTISNPQIVDSTKIISYTFFNPGHDEIKILGNRSLSTMNQVMTENHRSLANAYKKSGIYLEIDDIHNPKIFVCMEHEDADRWTLIIKKLLDKSLDSQNEPLSFPA